MKFKSVIASGLLASQLCSAAWAEKVTFQATDFVDSFDGEISPYETIDGEFDYELDENGAFVLTSAELRMGNFVLSSEKIGFEPVFDSAVLIGGLDDDVNGIASGNNDFWVYFDYGANSLSGFSYSTEGAGFFDAQTIILDAAFKSVDLTLDETEGFFVPMAGGFVNYDVALSDYESGLSLRQWSVLTTPNGDAFPIHKLRTLSPIDESGGLFIEDANFFVPAWFENGEYLLTWYVFDISTQTREVGTLSFNKGPVLPTPSPTPSPSISPSPLPSISPSPTPLPTPSSVPEPSPFPTPLPTETPTVNFSLEAPRYSEVVVDENGNLEVIYR